MPAVRRRRRSGVCRAGSGSHRPAGVRCFLDAMEMFAQAGVIRLVGRGDGQEDDHLEGMAQPFARTGRLIGVAPSGVADTASDIPPDCF